MLRARTPQQVASGAPGPNLQQFESEYVVERMPGQRGLLAQDAAADRAIEPIRRVVRRRFQCSSFTEILANFISYRLNTPQNVKPSHPSQRAAGARLCR